MGVFDLKALEEVGSVAGIGAEAACVRDLAVWFGLAGVSESDSSSEDEEDEGRSPGAAAFWDFFFMAASFLAFAAARRCSRVWEALVESVGLDSSAEESSSSDDSSEEDS